MTSDDAQRLLRALDDLCVRVRVAEGRLGAADIDIVILRRDIEERRDLVISYLAELRAADAADQQHGKTLH